MFVAAEVVVSENSSICAAPVIYIYIYMWALVARPPHVWGIG